MFASSSSSSSGPSCFDHPTYEQDDKHVCTTSPLSVHREISSVVRHILGSQEPLTEHHDITIRVETNKNMSIIGVSNSRWERKVLAVGAEYDRVGHLVANFPIIDTNSQDIFSTFSEMLADSDETRKTGLIHSFKTWLSSMQQVIVCILPFAFIPLPLLFSPHSPFSQPTPSRKRQCMSPSSSSSFSSGANTPMLQVQPGALDMSKVSADLANYKQDGMPFSPQPMGGSNLTTPITSPASKNRNHDYPAAFMFSPGMGQIPTPPKQYLGASPSTTV